MRWEFNQVTNLSLGDSFLGFLEEMMHGQKPDKWIGVCLITKEADGREVGAWVGKTKDHSRLKDHHHTGLEVRDQGNKPLNMTRA